MSQTLFERVSERAYYIWQKNPSSCAEDNWHQAYRQECQTMYDNNLDPISWCFDARIETLWTFKTMRGLADEYCSELQTLIELSFSKNVNNDALLIAQNNLTHRWGISGPFHACPLDRIYDNYFPEENIEKKTEESYWQIIRQMQSHVDDWKRLSSNKI